MKTPQQLIDTAQEEHRALTGKDCPLPMGANVTPMMRLSIVSGRLDEIRTARRILAASATPAPVTTHVAAPAPAPATQNKAQKAAAAHAEDTRLEQIETAGLIAKKDALIAAYKKLHSPLLKEQFRLANWEGLGLGKRRG